MMTPFWDGFCDGAGKALLVIMFIGVVCVVIRLGYVLMVNP